MNQTETYHGKQVQGQDGAMTIVPLNVREPLRKCKRITGITVVTLGALVLLGTMAWLIAYFSERGFNPATLRTSFSSEFGYWAPVLIFNLPGLLLVFHGKRMIRNAPMSLLEYVEVLGLVVATITVALLAILPGK